MKKLLLLTVVLFSLAMGSVAQSYQSMNNEDIVQILSKKRVQVVDVRTPKEFNMGHLPKAVNMDCSQPDFEKRIVELKRRHPVVVYCRTGRRSKAAAGKIAAYGYKVYEMDKGIISWSGEVVQPQ